MILVIGAAGHGKSSLIQALNKQSNNTYVEVTTTDLINIANSKSTTIEPVFEESPKNIKKNKGDFKKKNKTIKSWEKTKFYQK